MTVDIENKEWPEDGKLPELAGKANPFVVPEGYFDGLDERIMAAITIDELKNSIPEEGFLVPEGYFNELASNIQSRIAVEELIDHEEAGFELPAGYFDKLSANIQSRIVVEEAMEAGEAFEVPAGYFENLSSQIQSRVFVEEALSTDEAFNVPDGYFEQLNAKILNKTVTQETVQRKGSIIRLMRSTAFKYATAACFVLVAGAGFLFWSPENNVEPINASEYLHKELSTVPVDDLQNYIQASMEGADFQHKMAIGDLPVNGGAFTNALQEYAEMQ